MHLWYLSFATDDRGFLGATVVEAIDEADAFNVASNRGLNPGGEVAIWGPIPPGIPETKVMLNRLVGEDEMRANLGGKKIKELDADEADRVLSISRSICDDCNDNGG